MITDGPNDTYYRFPWHHPLITQLKKDYLESVKGCLKSFKQPTLRPKCVAVSKKNYLDSKIVKNLTFSGGGVMAMGVVCFCFLAGLPSILFPIFLWQVWTSSEVLRGCVNFKLLLGWEGEEDDFSHCRRGSHPSYGDASGLEWPLIRPMRPESLRKENMLR